MHRSKCRRNYPTYLPSISMSRDEFNSQLIKFLSLIYAFNRPAAKIASKAVVEKIGRSGVKIEQEIFDVGISKYERFPANSVSIQAWIHRV